MGKEPLRMCIACRKMKPKSEMYKIVKDKNGCINFDLNYNKEGRGAYICKDENCLNLLEKKKLLNRTFKCEIEEKKYIEIRNLLNAE